MSEKQAQVVLEIHPLNVKYVNVKVWCENLPDATPEVIEAMNGLYEGAKQLVDALNQIELEEDSENGYLPRAN